MGKMVEIYDEGHWRTLSEAAKVEKLSLKWIVNRILTIWINKYKKGEVTINDLFVD